MKNKILASALTLGLLGVSLKPAQARPISEAEGILFIIFGATVASLAISALENTTNGLNRSYYARVGVVNTKNDAIEYLATGKVGPSLARVYEKAVNDFQAQLSLEEFATEFVLNADVIEENVIRAVQ